MQIRCERRAKMVVVFFPAEKSLAMQSVQTHHEATWFSAKATGGIAQVEIGPACEEFGSSAYHFDVD